MIAKYKGEDAGGGSGSGNSKHQPIVYREIEDITLGDVESNYFK